MSDLEIRALELRLQKVCARANGFIEEARVANTKSANALKERDEIKAAIAAMKEGNRPKIVLWSLRIYAGKAYRVTGFSRGAGTLKGQDLVHYEPCYESEYAEFTRPVDEFCQKFEPVTEEGT